MYVLGRSLRSNNEVEAEARAISAKNCSNTYWAHLGT
jgi:hypothetical protein